MKNLCTSCDFKAIGKDHGSGNGYCMINVSSPLILAHPIERCNTYAPRVGEVLPVAEFKSFRGNKHYRST